MNSHKPNGKQKTKKTTYLFKKEAHIVFLFVEILPILHLVVLKKYISHLKAFKVTIWSIWYLFLNRYQQVPVDFFINFLPLHNSVYLIVFILKSKNNKMKTKKISKTKSCIKKKHNCLHESIIIMSN